MNDRWGLSGACLSGCGSHHEDGAGVGNCPVSIFWDRGRVNRLGLDETDDAKIGGGAARPRFGSSPSFVNEERMNSFAGEGKDGRDGPDSFLGLNRSVVCRIEIEDTVGEGKEGGDDPKSCCYSSGASSGLGVGSEPETLENYDFSDVVLKYIGEILMEDDVQEKACMFQASTALHATERSFYEALGQNYQPTLSGDAEPSSCTSDSSSCESKGVNFSGVCSRPAHSASSNEGGDSGWKREFGSGMFSALASLSNYSSVISSSSSPSVDGFADSLMSAFRLPEVFGDSESALQLKKETSRRAGNLAQSLKASIDEGNYAAKRNPHSEIDGLDESRSHKQSALCSGTVVSPEMFDMVLLNDGTGETALREALQHVQQNEQSKGSGGSRGRRKRSGRKKDAVDLRTLLTLCAQAVAVNDRRTADDFLRQIRQHSLPTGDGMQRMAHYFANGLEARLAAYHLYLQYALSRDLEFLLNKTIMNVARDAKKLHLIDFGILYGFQWPCLIERPFIATWRTSKSESNRDRFSQPGFRPADRVEETGRRLANYAKTFDVPFEFKAIAQRWDTIRLTDLRIEPE
ncbi:hypothetical protein MLD38_024151 [Melastoma candidum]|uniref:Uncharacterized protein n=1 Tax=Melastoma candidum TaxID=119954 RepID=A0ACB9NSB2_9MYRT|nr:hypothetical protein MLD38_024151 [Melastoma candidum]